MKTLVDNQQVKTSKDVYKPIIKVHTISSMFPASEIAKEEKRAIENGWELAWTHKRAEGLTSDYPGKAEKTRQNERAYKNATLLEDGEIVQIENRQYKVKLINRDVCDPIHFIAI